MNVSIAFVQPAQRKYFQDETSLKKITQFFRFCAFHFFIKYIGFEKVFQCMVPNIYLRV